MTEQRRLIVMRHAKAEPYAATDQARRLTDRGRRDAERAGAHLAAQGLVPDHAVVSTAERTRETWSAVAKATGSSVEAQYDAAVYSGGIDVVLEALRTVPAETRTLMFVGHNPTAAYLGHHVDDGEGDPGAISGMLRGFPAGALVVFEVAVPWSHLDQETGRALDFYAPEQ